VIGHARSESDDERYDANSETQSTVREDGPRRKIPMEQNLVASDRSRWNVGSPDKDKEPSARGRAVVVI